MLPPAEHPLTWLADHAENHPDAIALRDENGEFAYGELWAALGGWHAELAEAGFAQRKPLAILTEDHRRMALAVWLALYAGCPALPLDPRRPSSHGLIRALGIGQVLADEGMGVGEGARRLPASVIDETPARDPLPPTPGSPGMAQLLIATSGTEGQPKAVMLSADALAASATATCERFGLGAGDRWLCCLPVVHVGGLMIFFRCAKAGATVELRTRFDPAATVRDLADGVTHTSLSPTMLHCIMDAADDSPPPASLRQILIGGAPLPPALSARARGAGWPLTETYGMTETATHVAVVDPHTRGLDPIAGFALDLVDLGAHAGEPGRLRIEGPTLMLGYANPSLTPGDGLDRRGGLLTADLGREMEDGSIRLVGRDDDVIICGGLNIHPAEVEQLLAVCPDVGDIAITSRSDGVWGQQLVALFTGPAEEGACAEWVRSNLPGRFRPRAWQRVDELPKSHLGKLARRQLPALVCAERLVTVD
jgi:O-succinylbenzoic acid--CoA ligase